MDDSDATKAQPQTVGTTVLNYTADTESAVENSFTETTSPPSVAVLPNNQDSDGTGIKMGTLEATDCPAPSTPPFAAESDIAKTSVNTLGSDLAVGTQNTQATINEKAYEDVDKGDCDAINKKGGDDEHKETCEVANKETCVVQNPANVPLPIRANVPSVEVKLFVGRIPKTCEAEQLKELFSPFGPVLETAILRNNATNAHKGSAFVRMESISHADAAIRALNNIKILEYSLGPLQVRYASGEMEKFGFSAENGAPGQDQIKLFVGSLPRTITEDEIRTIFGVHGVVDEVFILRHTTTGHNKGCAFVKFAFKEAAINAVKAINGVLSFPGCQRPIEVRVAESKKTSLAQPTPLTSAANYNPSGNMSPMTSYTGVAAIPSIPTATSRPSHSIQNITQPTTVISNTTNRTIGVWVEYFTADGRPYYHNTLTNQTQWEYPETPSQPACATGSNGVTAETTGPPGANVFVFHIPNDWTPSDLTVCFAPFGTILSARIATDRTTNRNKGYAFISYDNINSAVQAVVQMNGFVASGKRLKVSIKQHEEKYVSHILPQAQAAAAAGNSGSQQTVASVPSTMRPVAIAAAPNTYMPHMPPNRPQFNQGAMMGMGIQDVAFMGSPYYMSHAAGSIPMQTGQAMRAPCFAPFPPQSMSGNVRFSPY